MEPVRQRHRGSVNHGEGVGIIVNGFLGHALVLIGLASAAFGSIMGFVSGRQRSTLALRWAERAAYGFAACMVAANAIMVAALLQHDFAVSYVAQVGSRSTPTLFTIVSLWSSLEGSILFWGLILAVYVSAFARAHRDRQRDYMGYALGVVLAVSAFFAMLIAGPANPFLPISPVPADGPGPNPLLQNHLLMIIHPPMLYCGYVGMTIPFGIAIAALLRGQLSDGWLKTLRRWTMVPWTFLSVGILLGAWWAYEVLGWGGYWAWDPVENASFLPWLAATGYLHSTVVQERKRILKAWTLSLVLGAFMLTILGTFMTRSGVFNSVHSFTQSPIGPVFLVFLGVVLVVSLALLGGRAHLLENEGRIEAVLSRETAFLFNNLLFVIFTFTVLLGTVFPLVTEAMSGIKVSVGEPYFNRMAVPLGLLMVFLMGVGPVLPWGRPQLSALGRDFLVPLAGGVLVGFGGFLLGMREGMALFTFGLCGFAAIVTLRELIVPVWRRVRQRDEGFWLAAARSFKGTRRRTGGYVVHLGIIIIVASVAASQTYKKSAEASLTVGQSMQVGPYTLTYRGAEGREEPHRFSLLAHVDVSKDGQVLGGMEPKLNFYQTQREPVGTPHVATMGAHDLYLSLLSVERDGSRVGIKAFVIPMVPWIWRSLPLLVLGSLISMWPRRRATVMPLPDAAMAKTS